MPHFITNIDCEDNFSPEELAEVINFSNLSDQMKFEHLMRVFKKYTFEEIIQKLP